LRWLQRYRAGDTPAIESAALRLLHVDPAAEVALPLLEEMVRQAPDGTRENVAGASTDHSAWEAPHGAALAIPPCVPPGCPPPRPAQLLWLAASRVELRAHEVRSWQLLTLALSRADLPARHVCSWWASCRDWWPDFPFQVFETPPAQDMPPVGRARAACAAALVAALQASPEGAPLAQSAAQVLRLLLQWADAMDAAGTSSAIPRDPDGAHGRVDDWSGGWRSRECEESVPAGNATEGQPASEREAVGGPHRRRPPPARAPFESANSEDDSEERGAARPAGNTARFEPCRVGPNGLGQAEASQQSQANSSQQSMTAWI
jgi:hypothetical protein